MDRRKLVTYVKELPDPPPVFACKDRTNTTLDGTLENPSKPRTKAGPGNSFKKWADAQADKNDARPRQPVILLLYYNL
jgi:hypothetical protein